MDARTVSHQQSRGTRHEYELCWSLELLRLSLYGYCFSRTCDGLGPSHFRGPTMLSAASRYPSPPMEERIRSRLPISPGRNVAAKGITKAVRSRSREVPLAQDGLPGERSPAPKVAPAIFGGPGRVRKFRSTRQNPPVVFLDGPAKRGAGKLSFRAFQRHLGGFQGRSQSGAIPERVAEKGLASL